MRSKFLFRIFIAAVAAVFAAVPAASDHTGHGIAHAGDLRDTAKEAEKLADRFRKTLDKALDRTIIDGTKREKQVERRAHKLENALDDVRKTAGRKKIKKVRKRVKKALKEAARLEEYLARLQLGPAVYAEWDELVARMDALAGFYELPPLHRAAGREPLAPARLSSRNP